VGRRKGEGGGFDLFILMIPGCIFFCLSVGWEKADQFLQDKDS
jgi:hypothetical protein